MTSHDEVIERLARETGLQPLAIEAILRCLQPGEVLGNGLWAAPEEPTMAMMRAETTMANPAAMSSG